jgi:hypothetical protein
MPVSSSRFSIAGAAAAAAHLLLLAWTVAQTLHAQGAQWQEYWIKFLALDFPLSLGVVPLAWLFPAAAGGPLHDLANFWWPLAYHGAIGTLWWYAVGAYIGRRIAIWRRRSEGDEGAEH